MAEPTYRVTVLRTRGRFVEVELAVVDAGGASDTELAVELLLPPNAVEELAARYNAPIVRRNA